MKTKLLLVLAIILTAFNVNSQVSITGVGATGGWGNGFDQDLTTTDNNIWTLSAFTMPGGDCKFRLDHDWTTSWGSTSFPTGVGTTANGPNIPAIAGTYDITFNQTTGEYTFSGGAPIPVVKLVGSAVTDVGGLTLTTTDLTNFTVSNATLVAGDAQFEVDGVLYGGLTFPIGNASGSTDLIPVTAGSFTTISVNISSGDYVFTAAPLYQLISLIGAAAGSWSVDIDLTPVDTDNYRLNDVALIVDECKFRKDHDWTTSFGDTAFPSGVSTGANIAVTTAGTYDAKLNTATGAYSFNFPIISLTGAAIGGWGVDTDLTTTDGVNYSVENINLTTDGCKFRRDNAWDVSWGGEGFPTGTPSNGNINAIAGNYDVSFNNLTKQYNFTDRALGVNQFDKYTFSIYPNPASDNFSIKGNFDKAQVYTISGQLVKTFVSSDNNLFSISDLNTGVYLVKVSDSNNNSKTLKLIKK